MVGQITRPIWVIGTVITNSLFVLVALFGAWFVLLFEPLIIHDSAFSTDRSRQFTFINWSSKTPAGLMLCDARPPESYLIFKDRTGATFRVDDDMARAGTGTVEISRFEMIGQLPDGLLSGPVWVRKAVNYACIFGAHKVVYTPQHQFDFPPTNDPQPQ